jgi:hypothetical protein
MHVRWPVGIRQSEAIQISLFPNPTSTTLNIVTDQDHCTYTIWSIHGQAVQKGEFFSSTTLQVGKLNSGLYILEIGTDHQREVLRFIKK